MRTTAAERASVPPDDGGRGADVRRWLSGAYWTDRLPPARNLVLDAYWAGRQDAAAARPRDGEPARDDSGDGDDVNPRSKGSTT